MRYLCDNFMCICMYVYLDVCVFMGFVVTCAVINNLHPYTSDPVIHSRPRTANCHQEETASSG